MTIFSIVLLTAGAAGAGNPVHRVIDGDTLVLEGGERIRLANIDAPKAGTPGASAATARLDLLARNSSLRIHRHGKDRYGRTLATLEVNGRDVGEWMAETGHALRWYGLRTGKVKVTPTTTWAQRETARSIKRDLFVPAPRVEFVGMTDAEVTAIAAAQHSPSMSWSSVPVAGSDHWAPAGSWEHWTAVERASIIRANSSTPVEYRNLPMSFSTTVGSNGMSTSSTTTGATINGPMGTDIHTSTSTTGSRGGTRHRTTWTHVPPAGSGWGTRSTTTVTNSRGQTRTTTSLTLPPITVR